MDRAEIARSSSGPSSSTTKWLEDYMSIPEDFTKPVKEAQTNVTPTSSDALKDLSGVKVLKDFLNENLAGLDQDHDGIATPMEMAGEFRKMKADGRAGKAVEFLDNSGFEIFVSDLSGDTGFFNKGITRTAIQSLDQKMTEYTQWRDHQKEMVPREYGVSSFGLSNFDKYDADKNGKVSRGELSTAMESATTDAEKSGISSLQSEYGRMTPPTLRVPIVTPILSYLMPPQLTKGRIHDYLTDAYHVQVLNQDGFIALTGETRKHLNRTMMSYYNDISLESFRQYQGK